MGPQYISVGHMGPQYISIKDIPIHAEIQNVQCAKCTDRHNPESYGLGSPKDSEM